MVADAECTQLRPHRLWMVAIAVFALVSATALTSAALYQREASRPVGEGSLFAADAAGAVDRLDSLSALDDDIRVASVRNELEIEAVALVGPEGTVTASTASAGLGEELQGLLAESFVDDRFVAIAEPVDYPIEIDGVRTWEPGDVLYRVYQPGAGEGGVVLTYDISELLERRAGASGIQPESVLLGGSGLAAAAFAGLLSLGRSGARRRIESSEARRQTLLAHNHELGIARAEAERALALAEETNRIRSEFVLMINHELRTPLTSVVTGAELLRDLGESMSDSERKELVDHVLSDGRRLSSLIGQLLTLARIENRGLAYATQPVSVASISDQLLQSSARLTIEMSDAAAPLGVDSDPEGLVLLLGSLADNAFTHGARSVVVEIDTELGFAPMLQVGAMEGPAVYFRVRDDGPGIPAGFLSRAFEKFEKSGRESGTGLGLYLARTIVEALGGVIAVHTDPQGTEMAVGVPLAPAMAATGALQ